jgi:hypothetical protein
MGVILCVDYMLQVGAAIYLAIEPIWSLPLTRSMENCNKNAVRSFLSSIKGVVFSQLRD